MEAIHKDGEDLEWVWCSDRYVMAHRMKSSWKYVFIQVFTELYLLSGYVPQEEASILADGNSIRTPDSRR